jgi:hypothetical protein
LNDLGRLALDWPPAADPLTHHRAALRQAEEIQARLEIARALEGIGRVLIQNGDLDEGRVSVLQAVAIYRELGVPAGARESPP